MESQVSIMVGLEVGGRTLPNGSHDIGKRMSVGNHVRDRNEVYTVNDGNRPVHKIQVDITAVEFG